jgi:hypothetical protein
MAATREDIKEWFERGVEIQATHMVVMVDTFDWDDYPVYIMPGQDPRYEVSVRNGNNMQNVMEVYNLVKPMQAQLDERRNFNY